MAVLVSAEDFSNFLGIELPDGLDLARMTSLLTLASDWAREISHKPWLLPSDAPVTARGIILAACRREWNNPKRVAFVTKGPQSVTFMQKAYPLGFFDETEERKLMSYNKSGDLWTQRTYRDDESASNGYLEVSPFGGYMPVYHPDDIGYENSYHL